MAKSKKDIPISSDEKHVDPVMAPQSDASTPPPLDIFDDSTPSAPELPTELQQDKPEAETYAAPPEPVTPTDTTVTPLTVAPLAIDTPESDAAIDDIVAQEADQVLAAEDANLRRAQAEADGAEPTARRGHPIFWFMILLLVLVALFSAYVLTHPDLNLPFSS